MVSESPASGVARVWPGSSYSTFTLAGFAPADLPASDFEVFFAPSFVAPLAPFSALTGGFLAGLGFVGASLAGCTATACVGPPSHEEEWVRSHRALQRSFAAEGGAMASSGGASRGCACAARKSARIRTCEAGFSSDLLAGAFGCVLLAAAHGSVVTSTAKARWARNPDSLRAGERKKGRERTRSLPERNVVLAVAHQGSRRGLCKPASSSLACEGRRAGARRALARQGPPTNPS